MKNAMNGKKWNRNCQQPINEAEGRIYEVEDRSFEITSQRITRKNENKMINEWMKKSEEGEEGLHEL